MNLSQLLFKIDEQNSPDKSASTLPYIWSVCLSAIICLEFFQWSYWTIHRSYTNNKINWKIMKPTRIFNCRCGETNSKIDDLSICPPNIILDLFLLLVIPYSCIEQLTDWKHILFLFYPLYNYYFQGGRGHWTVN